MLGMFVRMQLMSKLGHTQRLFTLMGRRIQYAWLNDHQFAPALPFPLNRFARPVMIRAGKSGRSEELLTREQQAQIDRPIKAELRRHGCAAPYDELFVTVEASRFTNAM